MHAVEATGVVVHTEEHGNSSIDTPHARNFLDCVRSRQKPRVDIEEGHWATSLAHLGNIVARTGRTIRFDAQSEKVVSDPEAARLVRREYRQHWSKPANV